jgi:shikimate dehydrogenase
LRNGLRFGLIGEQIGHSKSPAIFETIFKSIGREGRFDLLTVAPHNLRASLNQLVLEGIRGFSVTIPFKQKVLECLDDIDPVAQKVGAVNCIAVIEDSLFGYNTDCYGFAFPLLACGKKSIGESALIAGCGGSARAVAYSLGTDFGVHQLTILGRDPQRAEECKRHLERHLDRMVIDLVTPADLNTRLSRPYDIIVNCTPAGGARQVDATPFGDNSVFNSGGIYYDLNYNDQNRLVAQAKERGMIALGGAPMLVAQAVRSFDIWTDIQVKFDDIFRPVFGSRNGHATA